MLRKLVAAIIGVSALVPSTVFGLGMGEVELESYLNQPLEARIELLQTRGLSSSEIIANLATVSDFSAAGVDRSFFLSQLKFEIVQGSDGKAYLKVTSDRPVTEPYLNFLIEIQWPAGRLLREYTLLLDPPEFKDELPLAVRAAERQSDGLSSKEGVTVATRASVQAQPEPEPKPEQPKVTASYDDEMVDMDLSQSSAATAPQKLPPKSVEPKPAAKPAKPAPVTNPVSGSTVQTYTVRDSDTLSDIVRKTQTNPAISTQKALVAYQYLNPDAFIDNNMNLIKKGAVLHIPSETEIENVSRADAVKEIAAQNKAWRAKVLARQQMSDKTELASRQLDGTGRELTPDQTPAKGDDGRLSILVPGSNETHADKILSGQGGAGSGSSTGVSELQDQLALQQEEVEKFNVANDSLTGEITDVKNIIEKTDRVISLKNDQIASLNAQLKLLREQNAGTQAANTPAVEMAMPNETQSQAQPQSEVQPTVPPAGQENTSQPDQQLEQSQQPENTVAEAEPEVVPAEQQPDETSATSMLTNPLYLGGAGVLLLAILGLLWMRSRQDADEEDEDEDDYEYTESLDSDDDNKSKDEFDLDKAVSHEFATEKLDRQLLEAENDFDIDTVLSEADIYIAYGHFPKAIEMLQNGLKESPQSPALNLKLMEVHAESKDIEAFQQVETQVRGFTSDSAVLSKINAMRKDLGLAAGAGPAPLQEFFGEEETQFLSENTSTENLNRTNSEDDDFLSLADIEAELDVGSFISEKPKAAAPAKTAFDEELTADSRFVAEETQVNAVEDFDEELDLSGGALDFNFEETSVPEDAVETVDNLDGFSPDDALADIDQEIGNFDQDLAALEAEKSKTQSLQGNDLSGEFGDLDLDSLKNIDESFDSFESVSNEDFDLDITPEAKKAVFDEVAEEDAFDTNEAVGLRAEEELDLDSDFTLDDAVVDAAFDAGDGLSSEDASLLDGVDEVGTKLDLATAYIDMGDHEGAKDILDEVLLEGSEDQQQLARELLAKVG